ncbi:hypothetical protein AX17_002124 [Amanita inopinata Kibby_2008]|nr:hypothetical protein AX17_002124 [Amanita inopinata Kibby_2008]
MSINEPFALATYNNPLYASSSAENATVAVQSDGVHVIQLSTLRPIISHTLGPSTSFACPPLAISDVHAHTHTVYAVIQSSSELSDGQEPGKTLWIWREDLSSTLADRAEAHKKKISMAVPHAVASLQSIPELPGHTLLISPSGTISVLNSDSLRIQASWEPQDSGSVTLLKNFVFARSGCAFLPLTAPQHGAVIVLLLSDSQTKDVRVVVTCISGEGEEISVAQACDCQTAFSLLEILDISCSATGYLSILSTDRHWHSFTLDSSNDESMVLAQVSGPFRLDNLGFSQNPSLSSKSIALLPLTSSHVLLAGRSASAAEIIIHIWDLQYSIVIASHVLPLPASYISPSSSASISISLIPSYPSSDPASTSTSATKEKAALVDSQALLIISPSSSLDVRVPNGTSKSKTKKSRPSNMAPLPTTLFAIPYIVPRTSTIANAMGRASATAQWIEPAENNDDDKQNDSAEGVVYQKMDQTRKDVLQAMRTAMEGKRPQAANEAFYQWEKNQRHAAESTSDTSQVVYGYNFVKKVLDVVLQPTKDAASVLYSSEIIRRLIAQRVVSAGMMEGGLITVLRAKKDWKSIELALENVLDVAETEIVEALWDVVVSNQGQSSRNRNAADPDAMQVDNHTGASTANSDVPSLPSFLSRCVTYRATPAHLRLALRQQQLRSNPSSSVPVATFSTAESGLVILRVLVGWMRDWANRDIKLMPSDVKRRSDGAWVIGSGKKWKEDSAPELSKIVKFTEVFLDAMFLTLVQHGPAQKTLRELATLLEPEIAFTETVQPLYGALDEISKAYRRSLREAEERAAAQVAGSGKGLRDGRRENQEDWRQRRKRLHEQAGMGIGLYQVEELAL